MENIIKTNNNFIDTEIVRIVVPFFFIHRYFKSTIFAILNKEYAYSDNNVYKVSDIDKSKFKIVKIKNKNMIYPLAFDYNVE